jgi:predicted nuclease of predicted toxin-antitoxin system
MKIIVDENISLMTVGMLRNLSHDVLEIRGTPDEGMLDPDLWSKSQSEGRLVIPTDKGFSKYCNTPSLWHTDHMSQEA